jgi:uncharacterized membrane protein
MTATATDRATQSASTLRDPFLWIAITLCFAMLGWLSIARYAGYNAGMYDIGNMAQAIWSGSQGELLLYSRPEGIRLSRLAGHVEIGYLLLAPLYALWSDPRLLLLLQAALFALGALPAYRLAARRIGGRYAARCVALIYLLYPTAQTSVLFDFHADTIAAPLLMLALDMADARRWRAFAVACALALSFKFYVAAPVAAIGFVLWRWDGQPRAGAITFAAGIAYGLLAFFGIRPAVLALLPAADAGPSGSYIGYYFGALGELLATPDQRLLSAVVVFGPALLLAWRGWRWLLPGLPIALAALASTGPGGAYDYRYHHYALVVPFIIMAIVDGTSRLKVESATLKHVAPSSTFNVQRSTTKRGRSWRGDLGLSVAITAICAALLVNTPLNPLFWISAPGYGLDPSVYGITPRDSVKDAFLAAQVPPRAPIAASNFLAPHLANRDTLYLLRYPTDRPGSDRLARLLPQVDYAVADALFDFFLLLDQGYAGGLDGEREAIATLLRDPAFGLTATRDGLLLFTRDAPQEMQLRTSVEQIPDDGAAPVAQFGEPIALVRAEVEQITPRRLRATFTWRLTRDISPGRRFVAVSRLEGVPQARFVHLPTMALYSVWEWRRGELIVESFDVDLPEEVTAGAYTWRTGWYSVSQPASHYTDARSLLGGSEELPIAVVQIP